MRVDISKQLQRQWPLTPWITSGMSLSEMDEIVAVATRSDRFLEVKKFKR